MDTDERDAAVAATGFTREELVAGLEELRGRPRERDGRVCACGHPMTKHSEVDLTETGRGVRLSCDPVRMRCPCKVPTPVIEASDTRPFLHSTKGPGRSHALYLGIAALMAKDKDWRWLGEEGWPRCDGAGAAWGGAVGCGDGGVAPYSASPSTGRLVDGPAEATLLLCPAHAELARAEGLPS